MSNTATDSLPRLSQLCMDVLSGFAGRDTDTLRGLIYNCPDSDEVSLQVLGYRSRGYAKTIGLSSVLEVRIKYLFKRDVGRQYAQQEVHNLISTFQFDAAEQLAKRLLKDEVIDKEKHDEFLEAKVLVLNSIKPFFDPVAHDLLKFLLDNLGGTATDITGSLWDDVIRTYELRVRKRFLGDVFNLLYKNKGAHLNKGVLLLKGLLEIENIKLTQHLSDALRRIIESRKLRVEALRYVTVLYSKTNVEGTKEPFDFSPAIKAFIWTVQKNEEGDVSQQQMEKLGIFLATFELISGFLNGDDLQGPLLDAAFPALSGQLVGISKELIASLVAEGFNYEIFRIIFCSLYQTDITAESRGLASDLETKLREIIVQNNIGPWVLELLGDEHCVVKDFTSSWLINEFKQDEESLQRYPINSDRLSVWLEFFIEERHCDVPVDFTLSVLSQLTGVKLERDFMQALLLEAESKLDLKKGDMGYLYAYRLFTLMGNLHASGNIADKELPEGALRDRVIAQAQSPLDIVNQAYNIL